MRKSRVGCGQGWENMLMFTWWWSWGQRGFEGVQPNPILTQNFIITKNSLFKYIENFITKNWKFSDKNSDIFHISSQNIDCGYSLEQPHIGGSNEYPQFMFLSRNKKNNVYDCKLKFDYIKVGFKGSKLYRYVFVMCLLEIMGKLDKM